MSSGQTGEKRSFRDRVLWILIFLAFAIISGLVLWLRTNFWIGLGLVVGELVLLLLGIAWIEARDWWRRRREAPDRTAGL